jgi:uncharacterized membrane protein YgdD (TMEM256/DUF423 family)
MNIWIPLGSIFAGLGVILGALGAHSLKNRLAEQQLASYHTATHYLVIHSLALIVVGILSIQLGESLAGKLNRVGAFFTAGIILFSGSIYILVLGGPRFFGPVTPLGGLSFIIGWFLLAFVFLRINPKKSCQPPINTDEYR